jgi:catechol 2,3-dioxygenase-like lactoylglutathione lyase family enzyme
MAAIQTKHVFVYSLYCEDLSAGLLFYRDTLGLIPVAHHGQRPAFELGGGSHLILLRGKAVPAPEPEDALFPVLAIAVDALDEAAATLREKGVALPWGIEENSRSRWVKFYDPSRNLIELVEFK